MQKSIEPAEQKFRRLWLVRHGATLWNSEQRFCGHSDVPLSSEGQAQARWLADYLLQEQHISTIYTSDLLRARQTAEMIAAQSIRIEASSAWREIAFGAWEGLTYEQITQQFPSDLDFFSHPLSTSPPAGESLQALMQRVQSAFLTIAHTASSTPTEEGDIVLVSHGGPLRVLLSIVLAMPLEQQWRLRLAPGSLSAIDFLPIIDDTMPVATLALFNMQWPARLQHMHSSEIL